MNKKQHGFTLVEMAMVLGVISIIAGAGFSSLSAYMDNAKQSHTMSNLKMTKRAMLDYVMVNRHMPCPDTDGDGSENRESNDACSADQGTVPFNDIGLGRAVASDDYGNTFAYGVNTHVTSATLILDPDDSASYFGNQSAPAFTLQTPPTRSVPTVSESYTVCKKETATCNTTASNVEVSAIPAVIVAFNENGSATTLSSCNSESGREAENCNNDLLLWKGVFSDGQYDDQMVAISGYEIKQQVLDLLNNIVLNSTGGGGGSGGINIPDNFDYIVNKDMDSSNDLNVGTNGDNKFFITGNVNKSINTKKGDDWVAVMGLINKKIEAGADSDTLFVSESAYPPVSDSETDKLAKLQEVEEEANVDSFEKVCYYPDDEDYANAVCYEK